MSRALNPKQIGRSEKTVKSYSTILWQPYFLHDEAGTSAGINLIETLLTQWRSSVGVLNPSPLKTWPKWPPQAAHVISVLLPSGSGWNKIIKFQNSWWKNTFTAGNILQQELQLQHVYHYIAPEKTYKAIYGSRKTFVESWPPTSGIEFGNGLIKCRSTASAAVNPISIQLVVLPSSSRPVHYLA